jgi:hypothetical protein
VKTGGRFLRVQVKSTSCQRSKHCVCAIDGARKSPHNSLSQNACYKEAWHLLQRRVHGLDRFRSHNATPADRSVRPTRGRGHPRHTATPPHCATGSGEPT